MSRDQRGAQHPFPMSPGSSFEEIRSQWQQMRSRLTGATPDVTPAETVAVLKSLVEQAIDAGRYTPDAGARVELQWIALDIADAIFRVEGTFPNTVIRPLEAATKTSPLEAGQKLGALPSRHDPPRVSIARLPATSPKLFGRAAELAWLDACWQNGTRVASIIAFGGVGKSALVNAWLARLDKDGWLDAQRVYGWSFYSQGIDRLSSSDAFVDAALRWFGDPDPTQGSAWDKGERLAALVRKERTILLLDGLEPLQWGPGEEQGKLKDMAMQALVKELAAQNPGLCVITSRIAVTDLEALGANHRVEVHNLDHLSPEAGADLLREGGADGPDEELREAAREYEGHGLALTLLGTYVRKAHKGDVRKRDLIPPLAGKPAQRMMATYERWFADRSELAILRTLGLFDRPAPPGEIAAVRAEPPIPGLTDILEGLTDAGWNEAVTTLQDVRLLAANEGEDDRLDAHPLVREHFGEQLRRRYPEAWREGHRRLYEYLKNTAKPLPETVEEMAPLYAAVAHGCLARKNQEALDVVFTTRINRREAFFSTRSLGAFGSYAATLSAFFDPPWERLAPGLDAPGEGSVLSQAGYALMSLGRLSEAARLMQKAMERHVARESWRAASVVGCNLSDLLLADGKLDEALAVARKSVELADRSGDVVARAGSRPYLGTVLLAEGRREDAAAQFEEADRMRRDLSSETTLYWPSSFRYCELLLDRHRHADVRERAAGALERSNREHQVLDIGLDNLSLGRAHLLARERDEGGDINLAASHLEGAVDWLRRAGRQHHLPLGLLARAALHTHTRDFAAARRDLDEARSLAKRCGFHLHEADAHLGLARLCLAEGRPEPAREHLARARAIIEQTGYHRRDGELAELEAQAREMAMRNDQSSSSPDR